MPVLYPLPVILKCDRCNKQESLVINLRRSDRILKNSELPKGWVMESMVGSKYKFNGFISATEKIYCESCKISLLKDKTIKEIIE